MEVLHRDKSLDDVFRKYPGEERSNLIPVLQDVQEILGYISQDSVKKISDHMGLPTSKIYGVITFYNQFRLTPPGRHLIQICRGTACHVKGSAKLLDALQRELGIKVSQTTKDQRFTLETVACLGSCSIAPVVCIDGNFHGRVSESDLPEILKQYE